MKRIWLVLTLLAAVLLLGGCGVHTVEQMYQVPKRSEEYINLQSLIDSTMAGYEYSAPLYGENLQTVQMADLDNDGVLEYLLFTKGNAENPLQIFIFAKVEETYALLDTITSTGTAFDRVEYAQMDGKGGVEIVVGRQISSQSVRTLDVYTLKDGHVEQLLRTNYTEFLCTDLQGARSQELFVLHPGQSDADNGLAELYSFQNDTVTRSAEISMSRPADSIKRIMVGKLHDGIPAVYVASEHGTNSIITDIFAVVKHSLTNITDSVDNGTNVNTLRNYFVYADDIDNDGVLELPELISMRVPHNKQTGEQQYLIRWYALDSAGQQITKVHTYHNFVGRWYMELDEQIVRRMVVTQQGSSYEFAVWDEGYTETQTLMNVYVLTGQKREEQATLNNRFVLYRTENTVYAANLEVASGAFEGITKQNVVDSFHLIIQDWNTGETQEVQE